MLTATVLRTLCLGLLSLSIFPTSVPAASSQENAAPFKAEAPADLQDPIYMATITLSLHQSPSTDAPIILKAPKGEGVKVLDSSQSAWWEVEYNGRRGYAQSKHLEYSPQNDQLANKLSENSSTLYASKPFYALPVRSAVFQQASKVSAMLTRLPKGTEIKVVDTTNPHWWAIYYRGLSGYIQSSEQDRPPAEEFTSKGGNGAATFSLTQETSLRTAPNSQAKVLLRFSIGDEVSILDDSGEWWWKVSFRGNTGWVKKRLLQKQ